jgi:hypothetical protein
LLQFGSDEDERIEDVAVDASGNVLVTGWTLGDLALPNGGHRDAFVAKHAPDGTLLWRRQWRRSDDEVSMGIAADAAGRVFIAGYAIVSNASQAFVASFTAGGDPVWWRQFDARRGARAVDIAIDGAGSLHLAGHRVGGLGGEDLWVSRFDASGILASSQSLGGTGPDLGFGVAVDPSGRAYVAGSTWSNLARPPQYYDGFLARFPAD